MNSKFRFTGHSQKGTWVNKQENLSFDEIRTRRNSAEVSAIFHTIFSACKMVGVSALDYLKQFFEAMLARTDYDNLQPSAIGLKSK